MKAERIPDNGGFEIEPGTVFKFGCCDCGLVHDIGIDIEDNGNIGFCLRRNVRSTGQVRRHMKKKGEEE